MHEAALDRREARIALRRLQDIRMDTQRMRDRNGGRLDNLNQHLRWLRHNDERAPWAP